MSTVTWRYGGHSGGRGRAVRRGELARGHADLGACGRTAAVGDSLAHDRGPTGVGGPGLDIDEFSAIDTITGAQAEVLLEATDWGTQVSLALSSVTGPLECQLLLVRADGTTELVGSWLVPLDGYGTQAQPDPLLVQVPTATDRDELTKLLVQATDLDGAATQLVTVELL
jgi:hypothetical protein